MHSLLKSGLYAVMLLAMTGIADGHTHTRQAAQDSTKRVAILFPFDSAVIDSSFMNNSPALRLLDRIMSNLKITSQLDSIMVAGAASPEGQPAHNRRLAQRRANSLKSYITGKYPQVGSSIVHARAERRYWQGLVEAVERDVNVPGRDELLSALRNPGFSDEAKNLRLHSIEGGRTFAYLRDNLILRHLRTGVATVRFTPPLGVIDPQTEPAGETAEKPDPTRPAVGQTPEPPVISKPTFSIQVEEPEVIVTQPIAFRTNLLLDLIGGPNLGVEIPLGKHFSIAGDFAYAHTRIKNTYALQIVQGTFELSYWFNPRRNKLTGWHIGLYGTTNSRYDVQWGKGYHGDEFWSAGLSAGYSFALSDNFNLGFSVMGGYFHSPEVRAYNRPREGHLMWKETRYDVGRIALTQVRVNLVWLINKRTLR